MKDSDMLNLMVIMIHINSMEEVLLKVDINIIILNCQLMLENKLKQIGRNNMLIIMDTIEIS
jgi:hypothetical protein